ncbi:MAG: hypothetical protein GF344_08310, partial [Chitinivibrionales bacterium]|nr:hypothetical protein [Chitinivibrionales bacterium]
ENITVLDNITITENGHETVPPQRGIKFRPIDQKNMGPGVYYYMVAWRTQIEASVGPITTTLDTTFYSSELQMVVEADTATELVAPGLNAKTTDLTPRFEWKRNPGVPYYHVIVTDEEIKIDSDSSGESDSMSVEGLSVIWEAITSNEGITYGAPDPSGTITASPPPLSPGLTYSWIVLNNYGNHPAYTSYRVFGLPRTFTVLGEEIQQPVNVWPKGDTVLTAQRDSVITLKWTNLDSRANTYKVYLYVASDIENIGAQMVVWEDEVSAGRFTDDTASVTVNAKSILTANRYTWKAIAVDDRGAGRAGEVTAFKYEAPTGQLKILTKEKIESGSGSLVVGVAAVELKVEVLDGSMEAPLLFYTDNNGYLKRDRPEGTYRITAVKNGFEPLTRTLTVDSGKTTLDTFFLERPDATIFGNVVDNLNDPVELATVIGVSDRGDTIRTQTDSRGNYVLDCDEADWTIWAAKKGYTNALARDTSVHYAQSVRMPPYKIELNPHILFGVVRNENGKELIGVHVRLFREGELVNEVPSTPQTGDFSFQVESGTYRLTADKTGFTSYSSNFEVLKTERKQITMTSRAAVVKGAVYGKTWTDNRFVYAPITNATIKFIETTTGDTFRTVSDGVYGDFSISLPGAETYIMHSAAAGYVPQVRSTPISTEQGQTHDVADTLLGLGSTRGSISSS